MPASSGDPISGVLNHSLSASLKSSFDSDNLSGKLMGSAKRVLLAEIKYEKTSSYSTSVSDLKSKYRVLRPGSKLDSELNLVNGLSKKDVTTHREFKSNTNCNGNSLKESSSNSHTRPAAVVTGKCNATLPSPKTLLFPPEKVQLGWQSNFPIGSGMINMGNTCYLNSTLQALFHVPAFVNWILNDKGHREKCGAMNGMNSAECLVCAVQKTLKMTLENSASANAIRPHLVYSKLKLICKRLMHGHQEDAHEFLRYLLESMDRCYLRSLQATNLDSYSKETSALSQIFGGYLRTEVRCLECRNMSVTFQHFQDLLLDIRQSSTMEEALDAYFARETLGDGSGDETAYKCDKCHRRVAATKQFFVEKPPDVLCVQLKRFGMMGGKNSKHIQVSQQLDLAKYWLHRPNASARLQYRLVSLVSHIGPSANCGHYTAIGRVSTGHLYLFDDSMVRPVSSHAISGNNTYILMYEITSPNPSLNGIPSESSTGNCTLSNPNQQQGSKKSYSPDCTAVSSSENCSPSKDKLAQSPSPVMKVVGLNPPHLIKKPVNPPSVTNSRSGQASASASAQAGHKSLVPYSGESSDSESELTASKPKVPVQNGAAKKNSSCVKFNSFLSETSSKTSESSVLLKIKAASDASAVVVVDGWHVTTANSRHDPAIGPLHLASNSSNTPQQKWNVIDSANTKNGDIIHGKNKDEQPSVTSSCNGEKGFGKVVDCVNSKPNTSNGDVKKCHNGVNGAANGRTQSDRSWNGHRDEETRLFLQSNSHQGYGNHVSTWNGGRTQVDREAESERKIHQKRSLSQLYDDDIDQGKVKQIKTNHYHKSNGRDMNGRRNVFQEHQNHKNWYNNDRSQFYRTYSNNGHYNRSFQNRNSNYHWRR